MPKKIVLTTFGSLGDLHPYLAIALELQRRDHYVTIATSELYRGKIEALGIGFHAMRPDLPDPETAPEIVARVMDLKTGGEYLVRELLMPHLRDSLEDLRAAARDADVFVTHPVTFAAPFAAQLLQQQRPELRWVSTVLAPISLPSIYDPPTPPIYPAIAHLYKLGLPAIRSWFWTMRTVTNTWLAPYYALQQELGLPARGNPLLGGELSPERVLALFSSTLAAPQKDWPPQTRICGFSFFDARGALQPFAQNSLLASGDEKSGKLSRELEVFLAQGEAPVVFTLGSSAVMDAGDFYHASAEAVRKLGRRAILLAGSQANVPDDLPPSVAAFDYAPYSALFPHCAAIVHQGGVGTTAQALRSGKPQLIMPYSHDQPDHAARIRRMGVGTSVPRASYSAATASGALQKILGDPEMAARAAHIGAIVRAENGAETAANEIEAAFDK
ncbi:MAG TPA: glycosyltransferase [Abditibacteriaceae bacterium]